MSLKSWIKARVGLWVVLLVWLTAVFWRLSFPLVPYFDEVYHVPAAELIFQNDVSGFEWWHDSYDGTNYVDWLHPPVVKLIQAQLISWFGDSAFGWRIGSVLAGSLALWGLWELAWIWYSSRRVSLMAVGLLAADGLFLVQSRIAMLDIYLVAFLLWLVVVFSWWWKPQSLSSKVTSVTKTKDSRLFRTRSLQTWTDWWLIICLGVLMGLLMATKWTGILPILALLGIELSKDIAEWVRKLKSKNQHLVIRKWLTWLVLIFLVYCLSYSWVFLRGKSGSDILQLNLQALKYHFQRDDQHAYASTPLDWFLNLRPVWYWGVDPEAINSAQVSAKIYAVGNPIQSILISAGVLGWLWFGSKKKARDHDQKQPIMAGRLWLSLFFATTLPWFFSPRIIFYYYYLSAIPFAILIAVSWWHGQQWLSWRWIIMIGCLVLANFILWYPHWTGMLVPVWMEKSWFFLLPSWK